MNHSFHDIFDLEEAYLADIERFGNRVFKACQLAVNPPDVDVGITPHEVVYEEDKMRLLHYLPTAKKVYSPPLLVVYALINKPYILDLEPRRSVIRSLLDRGVDIYLIDWGTPTPADRYLSLEDYVQRYMENVVEEIKSERGVDQVSMMGYCLGGTLAAVYAALYPEKIRNLIVMAGPIDFDCKDTLLYTWTRKEFLDARKIVEAFGNVPPELLQSVFLLLEPVNNLHLKYVNFLERIEDEDFVKLFYRMERWLNDGVPVTGAFYLDLIEKWYQQNLLIKNRLEIDGTRVNLKRIKMPLLVITGEKDHIVPPPSSKALMDVVSSKDRTAIVFPCGHIGLSVGNRSHQKLWPKVAKWLLDRSTPPS